jgi:glycosyltransferase involved in cell wall biosynthesis
MESQKRIGKEGWVYKSLHGCDKVIARSANAMVFLSQGFRRLYATDRGIEKSRLHVVANWNNQLIFEPDSVGAKNFRNKLGIPDDAFIAACAGNIGVACNAEMLIDVFAKLKDHSKMYLVIAGGGSQIEVCRRRASQQNLERVIIHTPWEREETAPLLQMADVLLAPTGGRQSTYSIPSKVIGYLLSARPVLAGVLPDSDTAAAIKESNSGWVVDPDDVDGMAQALVEASQRSKGSLDLLGKAARDYALEHFTRAANLPQVLKIINEVALEDGVGVSSRVPRQGRADCA